MTNILSNLSEEYQTIVEILEEELYCLFDLNEMFDLLHTFTTKKSMKMKNRPPSAYK